MYTQHTYQDWEQTPEAKRRGLLLEIISHYKASTDFRAALIAEKYFRSENEAVSRKKLLKPKRITTTIKEQTPDGREVERKKTGLRTMQIDGNRVYSRYLYRIITQENQHLLGNGLTLGDVGKLKGQDAKKLLGRGFDTVLQQLGEKALLHGVSWGYWNYDHIEAIYAVRDALSGFVALLDEETSEPRLGIQFWQLSAKRPMYVRLFEEDGLTVYRTDDKDGELREHRAKRPYVLTISRDVAGEQIIGTRNYSTLPLVPLYGNPERTGELDNALKSKIDAYDRISSDFVDNLDRANDIYWVLNNFGGNTAEVAEMIEQIEQLRAVVNISDGTGSGSTAAPHAFEVPYLARQTALNLLEAAIYSDAMSLNIREITGGSLTNVAIKAAMTNLNLKCDRYEWQVFEFLQGVLRLAGIETEAIRFVRQTLVNQSEVVTDLGQMRDYVDDETLLRLNPYIMEEEVEEILDRLREQRYAGTPMEEDADGSKDASGQLA